MTVETAHQRTFSIPLQANMALAWQVRWNIRQRYERKYLDLEFDDSDENIIEEETLDFTIEFSENSWFNKHQPFDWSPDRAYRIFTSNHEEMTTKSEYDKTA